MMVKSKVPVSAAQRARVSFLTLIIITSSSPNFSGWLTTVLSVFDTYLDDGDYFYMSDVGWEDDMLKFTAFFSCYDDTGNDLGYVKIDMDTGEVLGHSWE